MQEEYMTATDVADLLSESHAMVWRPVTSPTTIPPNLAYIPVLTATEIPVPMAGMVLRYDVMLRWADGDWTDQDGDACEAPSYWSYIWGPLHDAT